MVPEAVAAALLEVDLEVLEEVVLVVVLSLPLKVNLVALEQVMDLEEVVQPLVQETQVVV